MIEHTLLKLFYTPIWQFKYPDFKEDYEFLITYFTNDEIYLQERERNYLQITRANLHRDPRLAKLKDFYIECAKVAMTEMGYIDDVQITSMWATRQAKGGHHHEHIHNNTFIVGLLYLLNVDNGGPGTTFVNSSANLYQMLPTGNSKPKMFKKDFETTFVPGDFHIFPGWLSHYTKISQSPYRIVVPANFMPVGKTNDDHFDRFNYKELNEEDLKQYEPKFLYY